MLVYVYYKSKYWLFSIEYLSFIRNGQINFNNNWIYLQTKKYTLFQHTKWTNKATRSTMNNTMKTCISIIKISLLSWMNNINSNQPKLMIKKFQLIKLHRSKKNNRMMTNILKRKSNIKETFITSKCMKKWNNKPGNKLCLRSSS